MFRSLGVMVDRVEKAIVIACFLGISVFIFSGVLSRFVFSYSIAWTDELVRFLFLWGALFGASAAFKRGEHGGLSILVDRFPPRVARIWNAVILLAVLAFLVFLANQALGITLRAFGTQQMSMTTGIPVWVVNGGMFLAFVFASIRVVQVLVATVPR